MKNTARLILAAIAVAAALVSCTKDLNPGKADTGSEAGTLRTITVSFNTPTKAYLDGLKPHFSEGDSILVKGSILSGDQRQTVYDTCIVSVKNGIATISTELTGRLQAYYPLASTKIEPDCLTQFVPPMQTGRFDDANICKADISSEGTMATFENLFPILRFYADAGIGVDTIRIKSSKVFAGLEDTTVITVTPPKVDGNIAQGVALVEEEEPVQDPRIWYVAIAEGHNANDLTFESVTNTQGTVEKTPTTDLILEKGKIYNAFIPYYIDLGDAGKWAYCNIGAFLPEESGDYFMWGEVEGHKALFDLGADDAFKSDFSWFNGENDSERYTSYSYNTSQYGFSWENTPYCSTPNDSTLNKYNNTDNRLVLEAKDDAATDNWGEGWRMPTKEEFEKMINICSHSMDFWLTPDEVFFFIPFGSGIGLGRSTYESSYYWSSTLGESNNSSAWALGNKEKDVCEVSRWKGCPIRPIYDPAPENQSLTMTITPYTSGGTL